MTTTRKTRARKQPPPFPIVAIGASAGGLEAFTELLEHLPADTGMGFVLIQHLDPVHPSELPRLLGRATRMPTQDAKRGQLVEPDNVYVIPPNTVMTIANGKLELEPRATGRRPQHVIDTFFESLANDQSERAIGVVLSGTASDGTLGLEAIKGEGGFTFAQDASAKYDSMPKSAIAAGCVDLVLSPRDIANELARFASHPFVRGAPDVSHPAEGAGDLAAVEDERVDATVHEHDRTPLPSGGQGTPPDGAEQIRAEAESAQPGADDDGLKRILMLLHKHSGVDFSLYKSSTIKRRVARRMVISKHDTYDDYEKFLRNNPAELDTLFSDALISVTNFFRNPEAFEVLKRNVFPELVKRHRDAVIRIWVLGCSTGQEAYSIGMAYTEFVDGVPLAPSMQIFATDLNEALLEKARAGFYAKSLAADISPQRLHRFFNEEMGGYRVVKPLREMVVFARQNLISDPPFSRLDLISCRNVLIYLDLAIQRKLLPLFHYALRPDGYLFLGASESVGQFHDLFEPVDKKQKIFVKKPAAAAVPDVPLNRVKPREKGAARIAPLESLTEGLRSELNAQREADRVMVNEFAPPAVLINDELQILQFRGTTSRYLSPATGKASFDILKMARPKLMLPLRNAITRARRDNAAVRSGPITDGPTGAEPVTIHVIPLKTLKERHFLVLFEAPNAVRPEAGAAGAATEAKPGDAKTAHTAEAEAELEGLRQRLREQERELTETRDYVGLIQEQADATHEELQASNEEAQSANEELQSINEELQTSKEELESTNEELTTVNEELAGRNAELARVNADLNNLHVSIHTAILVLNRDRTVRRFTPLAERAFNLMPVDIGRPIAGIRHSLVIPDVGRDGVANDDDTRPLDLDTIAGEVIAEAQFQEREIQDREGKWYLLRVRPFMTLDNKIDGAVFALVDVDEIKRSEQRTAQALRLAEATFNAMRDPHVVLGPDLRVRTANDAFYHMFKADRAATEGRQIYDLGEGEWNIPSLRMLLEDILPRNSFFNDFEVTHEFAQIGERVMLLSGRRWSAEAGETGMILLSIVDMTERQRALDERLESEARFRLLAETMPQKVFTATAAGDIDYCNPQWLEYSGLTFEQLKGWGWAQLLHREDVQPTLQAWRRSLHSGDPFHSEHRLRDAAGEFRWHVSRAVASRGPDGRISLWICATTDIHDVKESDQRKDEFLATLAHELRNPLAPMGNALYILQRSGAGADAGKSAIDMLQRQFAQAVRLMDDLLDVNRISRGKIGLHRIRMELSPAITQAVEAARILIQRMEQELEVELPAQPVYVDADPSRLVQIVGNLFSNASKFTDRGGRISVKAAREGNQAVIRIADNGIGIAPDQLRRIFDMFVQVDTSLERTQGGLGIGLTLVRKLVELHGGTIEAHSEGIGRGAEFVVRLPALVDVTPIPTEPEESDLEKTVEERRILVVDDNHDSAESLSMLLRIGGHEVRVANDGLEAVRAAAEFQPDVVLLDIGLPKLNGYEAGRRIRKQRGAKPLTLIALTGWGQDADRQRSREAGFDFHIVKPVDPQALDRILEEIKTA